MSLHLALWTRCGWINTCSLGCCIFPGKCLSGFIFRSESLFWFLPFVLAYSTYTQYKCTMDQKDNFFLSTKSNFLTQFKSTYLRGPRYSMPHISRSYFFLCILNSLFFFEKYLTSIHIQRVPALRAFWDLEKTVLNEIHVSGTELWSPTNANSPTYTYISLKPWYCKPCYWFSCKWGTPCT